MSPDDENREFPEWNPLQRTWPRISLKLRKDAFDHLPFEVDWDGAIYVDLPAELYLELFDVFERKFYEQNSAFNPVFVDIALSRRKGSYNRWKCRNNLLTSFANFSARKP